MEEPELEDLSLFLESVMLENKSIDTIYEYTYSYIKSLEESLTRIDNKFSTFIGFSSVLIRLSVDLQSTLIVKILICFFLLTSIIISTVGLKAKKTGKSIHPSVLMEDRYFELEQIDHQCLLINEHINLIDEYEKLGESKAKRFNLMIIFFVLGMILFGIGVINLDQQLKVNTWFSLFLQLLFYNFYKIATPTISP